LFDEIHWLSEDQAIAKEVWSDGLDVHWFLSHRDFLVMECLNGVFAPSPELRLSGNTLQRIAARRNEAGIQKDAKVRSGIQETGLFTARQLNQRGYSITGSIEFGGGHTGWQILGLSSKDRRTPQPFCYISNVYSSLGTILPHGYAYYVDVLYAGRWRGVKCTDYREVCIER
jgi:hypothetical protein